MQSRWRALLACRGLCEPWRQRNLAFAESSTVSTARLGAHHALSHTRINHLPRRRARSRSVRQQDSAAKQQSKMMGSMHRQ